MENNKTIQALSNNIRRGMNVNKKPTAEQKIYVKLNELAATVKTEGSLTKLLTLTTEAVSKANLTFGILKLAEEYETTLHGYQIRKFITIVKTQMKASGYTFLPKSKTFTATVAKKCINELLMMLTKKETTRQDMMMYINEFKRRYEF